MSLAIVALMSVAQSALPPIRNANTAVLQLRKAKGPQRVKALKNLAKACRGRLRHELKGHPGVAGELKRLGASGSADVKRAVLDAYRCTSPAGFLKLFVPRLSDADPTVIAYAAEVAARTENPQVVEPLLQALEKRKDACMKPGLAKPQIEVCVWLTYAPGAALGSADKATRSKAGAAATQMFESPYPKVREVAVETAASTRLRALAKPVAALIKKERGKAFAKKNSAALLGRFEKRRRALLKGER